MGCGNSKIVTGNADQKPHHSLSPDVQTRLTGGEMKLAKADSGTHLDMKGCRLYSPINN